ncbi:MAG: hypothetical protein PHQ95_02270 [Candidatus Gracilibacteria bacterium]|nr:hypothetical protein [Candidatus Gracilibacteria bacterium]
MKTFSKNPEGWFCGHWNGSNIQIKHSEGRPLREESEHAHEFAEYYLLLKGSLIVEINKELFALKVMELLMVESGEAHRISAKSDDAEYLIIKEKSFPGNKI